MTPAPTIGLPEQAPAPPTREPISPAPVEPSAAEPVSVPEALAEATPTPEPAAEPPAEDRLPAAVSSEESAIEREATMADEPRAVEPIPFPGPPAPRHAGRKASGPPTLKVTIGRIEVRPTEPKQPLGPYRRPGLPKPKMTLEDYNRRKQGNE